MHRLDALFGLTAAGTTPKREVAAGLTTFVTMAYILFVNPTILGAAIPVPFPQLLTATALAAAVGSITMGLLAKHPFALAPGMGLNAYFAFTVIGQGQIAWQAALGAVFLSGLVFMALSISGARERLLEAIPRPLRQATAGGIGLFLAFIGLKNAGLVVANPATLVGLGDLTQPGPLLCLLGVALTGGLMARRLRGAILVGIGAVTGLAIALDLAVYPDGKGFGGFPNGIVAAPAWPVDLWGALDLGGAFELGLLGVVFVFFFVDLFDTAGTFSGLAEESGLADADGRLPRTGRAFTADAAATTVGALLGTSTTTAYIESAAGIQAGGRTGLTAVVVGLCFALSVVLWPLAGAVPAVATAPALVVVGGMMVRGLARIDWQDGAVGLPAFLTAAAMPLTFSIANGIALGLVSWVVIHALAGRAKALSPVLVGVAVVVVLRYAWLAG